MENEESIWLKLGKGKKATGEWVKRNVYPLVIGLASLLVLIFVPMIGSNASVDTIIPKEPTAQFLFWTLKALTVALNLAIFSAFRKQAKVDIKDNANYKEACNILSKNKPKDYKPLSPIQFGAKQWLTKGICLALSTAITTLALTNIILYYDWVTGVSCLVSIIIAIIFGLMNMASEEVYWTEDFLQYAKTLNLPKENESLNKICNTSEELCENKENNKEN